MAYFNTQAGLKIYYEVHGKSHPPLILLHGLGSSTPLWAKQVSAFQKNFTVYLLDFPGHGRSDRARSYSIQACAEILKEFMDYLQLEAAHMMGLSLGCTIALTFAVLYPKRVLSLILEGPVGGLTPANHPSAWIKVYILTSYFLFLASLWKLFGKEKAIHFVNLYGFQTYGHYPALEKVQQQIDPRAVWYLGRQLIYPPYIGKLNQIKAPTLMITGQGDITPRRYYRYIKEHLGGPCQWIVVEKSRHIVAVEQPQVFNDIALAFLKPFLPKQPQFPSSQQRA